MQAFFQAIGAFVASVLAIFTFQSSTPYVQPLEQLQPLQTGQVVPARASATDGQSLPTKETSVFSATPVSGASPLTVRFSQSALEDWRALIEYGDGTSCSSEQPNESETCAKFTHTYMKPGTYVASLRSKTGTDGATRPPFATLTVSVKPATSAATKTYTSTQHGFVLQYPSTLTPETTENAAVRFGVPDTGGSVSVIEHNPTSMQSRSSCMQAPSVGESAVGDVQNVVINGRTFLHYRQSDIGLGMTYTSDAYTTQVDDRCVILESERYGTAENRLSGDEIAVQREKIAKLAAIFDGIKASFTITAQSQTSVAGMSKYTDSDFGFSFWYPSGWTTSAGASSSKDLEDCTFKGSIVTHGSQPSDGVIISKYYCPNRSITLRGVNNTNPIGVDIRYYFDVNQHLWMYEDLSGITNGSRRMNGPQNISVNTMGGLHIFPGVSRFGADVVIPLSARNFLVVLSGDGGSYIDERALAETILATDPAVATPVPVSEQVKTIQAEKEAYSGR